MPSILPFPTPPQHERPAGLSRVDGCPSCVANVEPPWSSMPTEGGGYVNAYTCTDCGHSWQTSWGS